MSVAFSNRTLPWDWYDGRIPANVRLGRKAYLESTYSFFHYRSEVSEGLRIGSGATIYLGTMFDLGPRGRVSIGEYALVNGAWIICDALVEIGDYALISWNVVLMDSYRWPRNRAARRRELKRTAGHPGCCPGPATPGQPIRIGRNAWIGFDCCVLPGVSIGEGSIVGARSVVVSNVPPFTVVGGNPARVIRQIDNDLETTGDAAGANGRGRPRRNGKEWR